MKTPGLSPSLGAALFALVASTQLGAGCSDDRECTDDDDCEGTNWCSRAGQCTAKGFNAGHPCEQSYHCGLTQWCDEGRCRDEVTYDPCQGGRCDAGSDASADAAQEVAPEPLTLPFQPSNLGALIQDRMLGGDSDVVVGRTSGCRPCACDEQLLLSPRAGATVCSGDNGERSVAIELHEQAKGVDGAVGLRVVFLKSLDVGPETRDPIRVLGTRTAGIVFVVRDDVTIATDGEWSIRDSDGGWAGVAMSSTYGGEGSGPGGGGYDYDTAAGGAFCSPGELGAFQTGPEGMVYGNAELVPLWSGSGGGTPPDRSGSGTGGHGGPALQIVAGGAIVVAEGAGLTVAGSSASGAATVRYGGGGGSGGALLLEAPRVEVHGALNAAGGVGVGSYRKGGDGGSGWIRINTAADGLVLGASASLTPDLSSGCATEGALDAQ